MLFEGAVWYVPQRVPNDQWQLVTFAIGYVLFAGLGGYTAHELNRMAKLDHLVWFRTLLTIAVARILFLTPWASRLAGDQNSPTWFLTATTVPSSLGTLLTIGRVATLLVLIYLLHRDFPGAALGPLVIAFAFGAFAVGMYPLVAADFFSVDTIFFKRLYVLIYVHLATRQVVLANCTSQPTREWVAQQARNLCWELEDQGLKLSHVIHDRDKKFAPSADMVLRAAGARVIVTPLWRRERTLTPNVGSGAVADNARIGCWW